MRRATTIVAVAEAVRRETIELFGVRDDRIVTIPNGVDPRRIAPTKTREAVRGELGVTDDATVIMSLGAMRWEKSPLKHLAVTAPILAGGGVFHVFAGDGPMRDALIDDIRQRGLIDKVKVLGLRADVGDLLSAADLLLFASSADGMEGMPAQVIEAGMAGVPVAAYAIAGVAEVVEDGVTGLLCDPDDNDGLRRCLEGLVADPAARRAMGTAATARCRALFDIGAVAPRYLDQYRSIDRSHAPPVQRA